MPQYPAAADPKLADTLKRRCIHPTFIRKTALTTDVRDQINPQTKGRVYDLVGAAGLDVSDWSNYKQGAKNPAANPRYCYEWSFRQGETHVVLNLWYANFRFDGDEVACELNMRAFANEIARAADEPWRVNKPKPVWANRAQKMDSAIQLAARRKLPVRIIVCEGEMRDAAAGNEESSKVKKRMLDPAAWRVLNYDWDTGATILKRDIPSTAAGADANGGLLAAVITTEIESVEGKGLAAEGFGPEGNDSGPAPSPDPAGQTNGPPEDAVEENEGDPESFAVPDAATQGQRNPAWSRDELILALDLYLQHRSSPPCKDSAEVVALSELLHRIAVVLGRITSDTYRNPTGVYMKMMNFRRWDPEFAAAGKTGLTRGNKDEELVWNEFSKDPTRLAAVVQAIRLAVEQQTDVNELGGMDEPDIQEAEEGRVLTRLHRVRERSRKLVEAAKAAALKKHGRLACEACGFEFSAKYGEVGFGLIDVHHTKPVHTLLEGDKTRLQDLALLCANCHRVVHSSRRWLSIEQVAQLIREREEAAQKLN